MTEILASLDDINTHLPEDKIEANDVNTAKIQVDAARMVRGLLAGTFTATILASWADPAHTPELIRGIAGRLIAAKYYAVRYAEDSDVSEYAQAVYNDAMNQIRAIRDGTLTVVDANDNPIALSGLSLSSDDFYPNDSAPAPKFTMDQVWG